MISLSMYLYETNPVYMTEKQVIRVVVQSLSHVWLFVTLRTAARQAALSITISRSLFKLMSIESVMASNHLILCHPLLLLPSICPSIRVFSSELAFRIRWPKYWSFSFGISPSSEYSGLISPIIVLKWFTGQFNWNKIKISYHLFYIAILTILST